MPEGDGTDPPFRLIDAVPKKRGPKTDVLEALLKRVDGLEAKLKEKKDQPATSGSEKAPTAPGASAASTGPASAVVVAVSPSAESNHGDTVEVKSQPPQPVVDTARAIEMAESAVYTPSPSRCANLSKHILQRTKEVQQHGHD